MSKLNKYKTLYTKQLFITNGRCLADGFKELQVTSYPFHTGVRVTITDGYRIFSDVHCRNYFDAIKEIRKFKKTECKK